MEFFRLRDGSIVSSEQITKVDAPRAGQRFTNRGSLAFEVTQIHSVQSPIGVDQQDWVVVVRYIHEDGQQAYMSRGGFDESTGTIKLRNFVLGLEVGTICPLDSTDE